jgi:hypothetical protein
MLWSAYCGTGENHQTTIPRQVNHLLKRLFPVFVMLKALA